MFTRKRKKGRKERATTGTSSPPKRKRTPYHLTPVHPRPNMKHRGSLRTSTVATKRSNTVHIKTVMNATICKKITSKQLHLQVFFLHTATKPRATLNLSP